MKTHLECFQCFANQVLVASRLASKDEKLHKLAIQKVMAKLAELDTDLPPPAAGAFIYKTVREISGNFDPYADIKRESNEFAMSLYNDLKQQVESSQNPLKTAVILAAAGNIIDFGTGRTIHKKDTLDALEDALKNPPEGNIDRLCSAMKSAENILVLGDNAGEIVLDRLMIEALGRDKADIIYAVRGGPIINDALLEDAQYVGMENIARVVSNGSESPGVFLDDCSGEFKKIFKNADVIVSKGQGNFEALSDTDHDINFILRAKCPVVSRYLNVPEGTNLVIEKKGMELIM